MYYLNVDIDMGKGDRMSRKVPAYKRKKQNKMACVLITAVVTMLLTVVAIDGVRLTQKHNDYVAQAAELQSQIDAENKRTEELKELSKYTKTKKFAEEVAEDKLGLVHDGEIIFKPDDKK